MPTATPPEVSALLAGRRRILVTGGAGYGLRPTGVNIGGAVVRSLLTDSEALVFNLDKCGYASDLNSIEQVLAELGDRASTPEGNSRHQLLRVDLTDAEATAEAVRQADADLVMHLAAESHVDRSIEGPGAYGSTSSPDCVYITSNVNGTFHLLQAVRSHWEALPAERRESFHFHHISTDEVFGSLGATGRFSETTQALDSAVISSLTVTEMRSLLSRRWRMGDLSVQLESVLFAALLDDINRVWLQRYPLDALHLAVALDLGFRCWPRPMA